MRTNIVIRHDDLAALKSHPIWLIVMELAFAGGAIEVVEIAAIKDEEEEEK